MDHDENKNAEESGLAPDLAVNLEDENTVEKMMEEARTSDGQIFDHHGTTKKDEEKMTAEISPGASDDDHATSNTTTKDEVLEGVIRNGNTNEGRSMKVQITINKQELNDDNYGYIFYSSAYSEDLLPAFYIFENDTEGSLKESRVEMRFHHASVVSNNEEHITLSFEGRDPFYDIRFHKKNSNADPQLDHYYERQLKFQDSSTYVWTFRKTETKAGERKDIQKYHEWGEQYQEWGQLRINFEEESPPKELLDVASDFENKYILPHKTVRDHDSKFSYIQMVDYGDIQNTEIGAKIYALDKAGVNVRRVLKSIISFPTSNRGSDENIMMGKSNSLRHKETCDNCRQVNGNFRNFARIDTLADNRIWRDGTTLFYGVSRSNWPAELIVTRDLPGEGVFRTFEGDELRQLVEHAVHVACWAWEQSNFSLKLRLIDPDISTTPPTHLVTYEGVSGVGWTAHADFPTKNKNPKGIYLYNNAIVTEQQLSILLERMIHEMGHTLGLYHEFDLQTIQIGEGNPRSIMSYENDRFLTREDLSSLRLLYTLPDGWMDRSGVRVFRNADKKQPNNTFRSSDESSSPEERAQPSRRLFKLEIYEKLLELFPSGNDQTFVMEFPGRVLNHDDFAYDTDSIYSGATKPQPVIEAEFHISDDLFDAGDDNIVGGGNGRNLSVSYRTVLNSLVPKMDNVSQMMRDKKPLQEWLDEPIEVEKVGDKDVSTRMELYQALLELHEQVKMDQAETMDNRLKEAENALNTDEALEDYTRWIARTGASMKAIRESHYEDLVARGRYHEVQSFLAYLDLGTSARLLNDAKASMRNVEMSSLDLSGSVYPVQFQPSDWFKSLDSNFTPTDLCLDPEFLKQRLLQKKLDLSTMQTEFQLTLVESAGRGNPDELKAQLNQAQDALDDASEEALQTFSESFFETCKMAYRIYLQKNGKAPPEEDDDEGKNQAKAFINTELTKNSEPLLRDEDFDTLNKFQKESIRVQKDMKTASRKLARALENEARSRIGQGESRRLLLQGQMNRLRLEIESLEHTIYESASSRSSDFIPTEERSVEDQQSLPPQKAQAVGSFLDIIMNFETSVTEQSTIDNSSASQSSTDISFLFGGYNSMSSTASAQFRSNFTSETIKYEVAFRATKVELERGWFRPEIFVNSREFLSASNEKYTTLMKSFPVAFIVVKDVTIKVQANFQDTEEMSDYLHKESSSSGGFLCFTASSSQTSTQHSESSYSSVTNDGLIIRIPGPQILGWFLQNVPEDRTGRYESTRSSIPQDLLDLIKVEKEN